jgi:integrase
MSKRAHGEGSVYRRKSDGRWFGAVTIGFTKKGRQLRRTVSARTQAECLDKLKSLKTKKAPNANRQTLAEFLEYWLEHTAKNRVQRTTLARYISLAKVIEDSAIGNVKVSRLEPEHVEVMYKDLEDNGKSVWTRFMAGTLLRNALTQAVRRRELHENPCIKVPKPRPARKEMQTYDATEVKALLEASKLHRLHALFVLAVTSGMREGELFGLDWSKDIDLKAGTVKVQRSLEQIGESFHLKEPKSASGIRTIRLPPFAVLALADHRARMLKEGFIKEQVFCDTEGKFLRQGNFIRRVYRPIQRAAGLREIRFHDLRHTAATLMLDQGVNMKIVQQRLGHKDVSLTLRTYTHALPRQDQEAVEIIQKLLG